MNCEFFKKNSSIIHIFALLHAIVSLACYAFGIADDLMLTLLTMLLMVVLCLRQHYGIVFLTLAIIFANLFGLAVGKSIPYLFAFLKLSPIIVHPITTFLCTELIGWIVILLAHTYQSRLPQTQNYQLKGLRYLLAAIVIIIIIRMIIIIYGMTNADIKNFRVEMVLNYFFSCIAIIAVVEYSIRAQEKQQKASEEAALASFKYMKLKQQVNPHFLFNTLNVLDYLIQEYPKEEASRYTHQLAEIYRYMIKNENETTVRLRDELGFVDKYISLIQLRFPKGVELKVNVEAEAMMRSVIPSGLQLLIENAIKHNSVSANSPLMIDIDIIDDTVVVSNNIQRRLKKSDSTGFGLKYLKEQYKAKTDRAVVVDETESRFTVRLPLL